MQRKKRAKNTKSKEALQVEINALLGEVDKLRKEVQTLQTTVGRLLSAMEVDLDNKYGEVVDRNIEDVLDVNNFLTNN
ncbi:MAG: hypothetical protein WC974_04115 [Thermoplasmata archaeon]